MIDATIYFLGSTILVLLCLYALLGAFRYYLFRRCCEVDAHVGKCAMPVLRPIPIPTKKHEGYLHQLAVAVFDVRKWELVENWRYSVMLESGEKVEIVIPKNFCFDGASIPRPLWAFLNPIGTLLIPGLIHDYAYRYQLLWKVNASGELEKVENGSRHYWDRLFRTVNTEVNGMPFVSLLAWVALFIGGCWAWEENREEEEPLDKPDLSEKKIPCSSEDK